MNETAQYQTERQDIARQARETFNKTNFSMPWLAWRDEIKRLEDQNANLKASRDFLEARCKQLRALISSMTQAAAPNTVKRLEAEDEAETLRLENAALKNKNINLNDRLRAAIEYDDRLLQENKTLKAENDRLASRVGKDDDERERLKAEKEQLKRKADDAAFWMKLWIDRSNELAKKSDELEKEVKALRNENHRLKMRPSFYAPLTFGDTTAQTLVSNKTCNCG